jgi:hypothetical protein
VLQPSQGRHDRARWLARQRRHRVALALAHRRLAAWLATYDDPALSRLLREVEGHLLVTEVLLREAEDAATNLPTAVNERARRCGV